MYTTVTPARTWQSPRRWTLCAAMLVALGLPAGRAAAWHCGWEPVGCDPCCTPCPTPWVGDCSYRSVCTSGWGFGGFGFGFGVSRFRSFGWASPGLWCGSFRPCVVPAPVCGWYPSAPIVLAPTFNCFPGAFTPVYGPVGVAPLFGIGGGTTVIQIGRGPTVHVRQVAERRAEGVRASHPAARARAARLVAIGDRHLRAAVNDRAKLRPALDAYRRAEAIAADQPDTCLRQAIVLTALERADDAAAAVKRAVAIEGRLAEAAPPAPDGPRLPPDPAFGDRPLGEPSLLATRSHALIGGIFGAAGGGAHEGNWIAARWAERVQGDVLVAANR